MNLRIVLPSLALLSALTLTALAADEKKEPLKPKPTVHAGLDQFKQLAGDWVGKGPHEEKEMMVNYKVTSNGSAVVETIMPGTDHEMVTVIHQDGKDLALTHYCALGNQPHMKTSGKQKANQFAFEFTGASNMDSENDMHMHSVVYTFVDKDTLKADWSHYVDGKEAGKAVIELKRKKA
ncbi:MAG TPA: hypothetical protein VGX78_19455, partial [Pirellulales bacterium]|nr:hypothetical protein [Pirellulales bacterium]